MYTTKGVVVAFNISRVDYQGLRVYWVTQSTTTRAFYCRQYRVGTILEPAFTTVVRGVSFGIIHDAWDVAD